MIDRLRLMTLEHSAAEKNFKTRAGEKMRKKKIDIH
jgi:hypothetical protein